MPRKVRARKEGQADILYKSISKAARAVWPKVEAKKIRGYVTHFRKEYLGKNVRKMKDSVGRIISKSMSSQ